MKYGGVLAEILAGLVIAALAFWGLSVRVPRPPEPKPAPEPVKPAVEASCDR